MIAILFSYLKRWEARGCFEPWRVEMGAVVWFCEGPGGHYDYWPDGLSGPMRSERPPSNRALVADNDRMSHRIGWIGEPATGFDPALGARASDAGLAKAIIGSFTTAGCR